MIFQILLLTVRHMAPRKGIYEETPFLKLLPGGVSPRVKRGWAPCRLGFLGISFPAPPPSTPPLPSPSPRQHFSLRFHFLPPLCFVLIIPRQRSWASHNDTFLGDFSTGLLKRLRFSSFPCRKHSPSMFPFLLCVVYLPFFLDWSACL